MKKLLALLLTVVMVLSIMVPAAAETTDTDTTAPEAPVLCAVQVKEGTNGYNVRFLSTVHSLSGSKVGYEISALFTNSNQETKRVVYSVANGDTQMESDTVYGTVKAVIDSTAGEQDVTAAQLATFAGGNGATIDPSTAKGIFAVAIANVPNNIDVAFTIKSYVVYNGETIESKVWSAKYEDGKYVADSDLKIEYQENFNALEEFTKTLANGNTHSSLLAENVSDATIKGNITSFNNELTQKIPGWKLTAVREYSTSGTQTICVENDAVVLDGGFSTVQVAAPGTMSGYKLYSIDMDITMDSSSSRLDLLFNNSTTVGFFNGTGNVFTFKSNNSALTMGLSYYSGMGTVHDKTTNDITYTPVDGVSYKQVFHLTLLVDNLNETAKVLINGKEVTLATDNVMMYEQGGGLELLFQGNVKIDNIVMLGQSKGVSYDATESKKTLFTSLTSKDNDLTSIFNFKKDPNDSTTFRYENHVKVEGGTMTLTNGGFHMFELTGSSSSLGEGIDTLREGLDNQAKYVVEMDVQMSTSGYLYILFNTEGTDDWATKHYAQGWNNYSCSYFFFGKFAALKLNPSSVEVYNYTNSTSNKIGTATGVDLSTATVKVVLEVDNTGADSVVNVYVGNTKVIDSAKVYNNDGGIYFWNQENSTPITVSNLTVYTGEYTTTAN